MSLTNSQVDELMRNYNRTQNRNNRIHEARLKEVGDKVYADFGVSLLELNAEKISLFKSKLFSDADTCRAADDKIASINAKENELIKKAGFSEDYLNPIYTCELCHDTGYIGNQKCQCFKKAGIELLYENTNNKNLDRTHTFENFDFSLFPKDTEPRFGVSPYDNAKSIVKFCKGYVSDFDAKSRNIFFYGNVGAGKTYLTDCISNELIQTLHSVIYTCAHDFFNMVADYEFNRNTSDKSPAYTASLLECDLLVIDDLGSENINSFTQSTLFYYINERLLLSKSTIISSNYALDDIRQMYSERISSRIFGSYTQIPVFGNDLRVQK